MRVATFEQLMDRIVFPRGPEGKFTWNYASGRQGVGLQFQEHDGRLILRYPSYAQPKIILKAGIGVAVENSIAYIIRAAHPETAMLYQNADGDTALFSHEEIVNISKGALTPGRTFRLRPFDDSEERVTLLGDAHGVIVRPGRSSFDLGPRQILRYRRTVGASLIDILPCTLPQALAAREEIAIGDAVPADGAIGVVAADMRLSDGCFICANPVSLSVAMPLPEIMGSAKWSVLWDRLTIEGGSAMLLYRWGPQRTKVLHMLLVRPGTPEAELRSFLRIKLNRV